MNANNPTRQAMQAVLDGATKSLADWLPENFLLEFADTKAAKFRDVAIVAEMDSSRVRWPGKERNVHGWVKLANGYAVGWNENPGRGWSFPVMKIGEAA